MLHYLFWLSDKIDDDENQNYISKIEKDMKLKVIPYNKIDTLLFKIKSKEMDFNSYIVILDGRVFPLYIDKIKTEVNLFNIPLTIIFTKRKNKFIQNIEGEYSNYLNHKFFNILGIVDTYRELKEKILSYENELDKKLSKIKLGSISRPEEYENCFAFEYIQDFNQLIFPYYYQKIMSTIKIDYSSVRDFNLYLFENFGQNKKIIKYLKTFLMCEDVPNHIVAKYWGKIYTLETSFYHNLNWNLMKLEYQNYYTFIRIFYSGFKELSFKDDNKLYRGANLSTEEIAKIKNFFNENENNQESKILIYSRAFLSFSLNKERVKKKFMRDKEGTEKVFFILENKSKDKFVSNADFRRINSNQKEEEILFFPFSSFIIESIKKEDDYYLIEINYIGIYEKEIQKKIEKIKDHPEILEIISDSKYSKDVFKSEIMPKEINETNINNLNQEQDSFNDNEKRIANSLIELNKKNLKEKKIVEQEINEEEDHIQNEYIKFCFCKKDKWYISKLNTNFNLTIYEYANIEDIFKIINDRNLKAKECLIILSERLFPLYINKIKNFEKKSIPLLLIYSSINIEIPQNYEYLKYLIAPNYNCFGIFGTYQELKEKIIEIINSIKKNSANFVINNHKEMLFKGAKKEKKESFIIDQRDSILIQNKEKKESFIIEHEDSMLIPAEEKKESFIIGHQDSMLIPAVINKQSIPDKVDIILNIIFSFENKNSQDSLKEVTIQCNSKEKVSKLIQMYKSKINNFNDDMKFIYRARPLNLELTLEEADIKDNSIIYVSLKSPKPHTNEIVNVIFSFENKNSLDSLKEVTIQCNSKEKVSKLIQMYKTKINNFNDDMNFIYKARPLNPGLTLEEADIKDNSNILVILKNSNKINIIFSHKDNDFLENIEVQCKYNEKISDLIEKYMNETNDFDENKNFYFKERMLNPEKTVEEEQITDNAIIDVVKNNFIIIPEPEEITEQNLNKKLKILLINLEANNAKEDDISEKIDNFFNKFFDDYTRNNYNAEEIKNKFTKKIYEIFDMYLNLEKNNSVNDKNYLLNLINYIYQKSDNTPDKFIDYIKSVIKNLYNFRNYSNSKKEIIIKYIKDFLQKRTIKAKEEIWTSKYKNNNIVTYEQFIEIIMENNENRVFMENIAIEYLLYLMKKSLVDKKVHIRMNRLNMRIFLKFFNENLVENEDNILKDE